MTDVSAAQLDPYGIGFNTGSNDLWGPYLGPMPQLARVDPYENRNADKWNMPENYKGKNLYLRDTLEDWMFTADQDFYTTRILPWRITDQVNIQWERFEANAHLMGMTPYQTPSSLITQKRKFMKANLVRRGIAAEFEHDFLRTPLGRSSFIAALGQMGRSVQETANAECVRTLVHAHRYQHQHLRELGIAPDAELKQSMQRDRDRFAIVQTTKNGLEKLDMQISKEMHDYRGRANAYLIPEEISIYATIVRPEKTDYYLAGQLGPDRVNGVGGARPSGGTAPYTDRVESQHMVRNNAAYIVKTLHVDGVDREQEELLTRVRQIGEYMTMLDDTDDYSKYESRNRSIMVYNQDIDDMTKITLEDAVEHCGLWDDKGNVRTVSGNSRDRNIDLDQDFLSHHTGIDGSGVRLPRRTVEYVYQIHPDYIPANFLCHAGQTLFNAGGSRGLAVGGNRTPERPVPLAPAPSEGYAGNIGASVDQPQQMSTDKIDKAFLKMIASGAPATERADLEAISESVGSVYERGERMRDRLIEMVESNVPGMQWQDAAPVSAWYNARVEQHKKLLAEQATQQTQQQRLRPSDSGMGLAGIGQMAWQDPNTKRSQSTQEAIDRQQRDRIDQINSSNLIIRHTVAIESTGFPGDVKDAAREYLRLRITKSNMMAMINRNILLPMNFLFLRPHMQYATKTIIKCQQDGGSGYTFIGNSNLQISHEAGRKMALMHYTTHMRCVITNPENVYVQPDAMVIRAEGGAGVRFYSPETYAEKDLDDLVNSLICVAVPPAETNFPSPLDTSGRFHTEYNISVTANRRQAALHYSTAGRYNQLYNFHRDRDGQSTIPFVAPGRTHVNRVCYQGHQQNFNPKTGQFDRVIVNKGHWTKNVYAGCKNVREGAPEILEAHNYAKSAGVAGY